jgi:arylsulfatase A-like enzyme
MVIFTSDNGCAPGEALALKKFGHDPSYIFRGYKLDLFEGGHRVPFIVRWPGKVKPDSVCNDTICLTDMMATVADILDYKLPDNAGEDSVSILPDLLGTAKKPLREATVYNTYFGFLAIRKGKWKLILNPWSGGWSQPPSGVDVSTLPPVQLYDLSQDIGETKNLQDQYPEVVKELTSLLQSYVDRGRSTPGKSQKNEGDIDIVTP